MGFEEELTEAAADLAMGGDGSDDEALNDTARGMMIHRRLSGGDATEEDYREVVEGLRDAGKSAAEAQMVVRGSMMVLGEFGDEQFKKLNAAIEEVYDVTIE